MDGQQQQHISNAGTAFIALFLVLLAGALIVTAVRGTYVLVWVAVKDLPNTGRGEAGGEAPGAGPNPGSAGGEAPGPGGAGGGDNPPPPPTKGPR